MSDGRFVVTVSNGINIFDYAARSIIKQQTHREVPLQIINQDALFIASDSTLFVGGIDGMISFRMEDITAPKPFVRIFPMSLRIRWPRTNRLHCSEHPKNYGSPRRICRHWR